MEKITARELGDSVVICNADTLRDFHPRSEEIKQRFEDYYPEITAPYAQEWNKGLRDYCEANRLNYILETTFSSGSKMNETIADLHRKDYRVEIKLLAVHPKLSLLSTHARFEDMKLKENTGRLVGKEAHDNRYYLLAPTLFVVQGEALYNKLQLYGRSITMEGHSFQQGVMLLGTNPPNAVQLLQQEIDRKWSPETKAFFDDRVHYVIDMKIQRNAPQQEISAFRNEMKSDYPTQLELQKEMEQQIKQQETTQLLEQRKSGILPQITIAGTEFIIDLRKQELRERGNPKNRLDLRQMEISPSERNYLCFYNTQTHQQYFVPKSIKTLPEHVVMVEIPNEFSLDPYAMAIRNGREVADGLKEFPSQKQLSAKITTLSETTLPKLVQQNIAKEKEKKQGQNRSRDRRGFDL